MKNRKNSEFGTKEKFNFMKVERKLAAKWSNSKNCSLSLGKLIFSRFILIFPSTVSSFLFSAASCPLLSSPRLLFTFSNEMRVR